jgi:hypothetical protein
MGTGLEATREEHVFGGYDRFELFEGVSQI